MNNVESYFRFVGNRRVATGHGVLPETKLFLAILLSIFVAILFTFNVLDPLFFEWKKEGLNAESGWFKETTDIGRSDWWLISTGSIVLFMSVYRDNRFSVSHLVNWHYLFLKFYFAFTTIVFSGLIAVALKNLIGRARPHLYDVAPFWDSVPFADPYDFASFPSGHSTTIGALAAIVFLLIPKLRWLFIALALWVGASRIAIGVHFPSDVVAGLSLGVLFTWFYARLFARKRLLFEFNNEGDLRLRNLSAKRARRKIRKGTRKLALPGIADSIKSKASH